MKGPTQDKFNISFRSGNQDLDLLPVFDPISTNYPLLALLWIVK